MALIGTEVLDLTSNLPGKQGIQSLERVEQSFGERTYEISAVELDLDMDIDARRDVLAGIRDDLDRFHVLVASVGIVPPGRCF